MSITYKTKEICTERNPMKRRVPRRDPSTIECILDRIEEQEFIERVQGMILGINHLKRT